MLVNSFVPARIQHISCQRDLGRLQSFEIIKEIYTVVEFGLSGDNHSAGPFMLFLEHDYENTTIASER